MRSIKANTWIRYILPFLISLFFSGWVVIQSMFREPTGAAWHGLLWFAFTTFLLWEVNLQIGLRLDARIDWNTNFLRRMGIQLLLSYAINLLLFNLSYIGLNWYETKILHTDNYLSILHVAASTVLGIMLITFINVLQIGFQLLQAQQKERMRAERYQRESISARLESLKQQIDPHFLFNNFSTLYGLIYEDQEKAGTYLLKLSDIYRLVLEHLDRELVTVSEELALIHTYCDLLSIRYGTALAIQIDLPKEILDQQIMPFALQLLVENAIKHNQIEQEHPLQIRINYDSMAGIQVENNLVPRSSLPVSGKIGLKNLQERYQFRLGKSILVKRDRKRFLVTIPLFKD